MEAPQDEHKQLVATLESLQAKKTAVNQEINANIREKSVIEQELAEINKKLLTSKGISYAVYVSSKSAALKAYDKAIAEAENSFTKIIESSSTLLHVLQRESVTLSKRAADTAEKKLDSVSI